jgi:membrane-bound ClpP family serine protease|tara:strand:- start:252 stop:569 length:318 start_codon:yes stop_codon:yes gene_type:complete
MTKQMINYQQIYEDELPDTVKDALELPRGFYELKDQTQQMVEKMIDAGYSRAVEDALDQEVLNDTAALAAEMGTQLYHFANVIGEYLTSLDGSVEPNEAVDLEDD